MTSQDLITLIGINIAMFGFFSTIMYWMLNRIDADIKSVGADVKSLSNRVDGHASRIDQLYRMFIDLVKEKK